jgi:hypothetical protein
VHKYHQYTVNSNWNGVLRNGARGGLYQILEVHTRLRRTKQPIGKSSIVGDYKTKAKYSILNMTH